MHAQRHSPSHIAIDCNISVCRFENIAFLQFTWRQRRGRFQVFTLWYRFSYCSIFSKCICCIRVHRHPKHLSFAFSRKTCKWDLKENVSASDPHDKQQSSVFNTGTHFKVLHVDKKQRRKSRGRAFPWFTCQTQHRATDVSHPCSLRLVDGHLSPLSTKLNPLRNQTGLFIWSLLMQTFILFSHFLYPNDRENGDVICDVIQKIWGSLMSLKKWFRCNQHGFTLWFQSWTHTFLTSVCLFLGAFCFCSLLFMSIWRICTCILHFPPRHGHRSAI